MRAASVLVLPLLLFAPILGRADESYRADRPATLTPDPARDCRLTLHARQALQQDIALAGFTHLGVSVRGGTAILWGDVPSVELARRAEMLIRQVVGVNDVRNDVQVERPDDPLVELLRSARAREQVASGAAKQWVSANRPALVLTGRPDAVPSLPAAANGVTLLPPTALESAAATLQKADPKPGITALCQAEPRFLGIVADVQDGVVRLGGTVSRWEDLHELARAIARLPGVERVLLTDVRRQ